MAITHSVDNFSYDNLPLDEGDPLPGNCPARNRLELRHEGDSVEPRHPRPGDRALQRDELVSEQGDGSPSRGSGR